MLFADIKSVPDTKSIAVVGRWRGDGGKQIVLLVSAMIFFVAQILIDAHDFKGDARLYWALSSNILTLDYPQTVRGYFYPLLLAPFRAVFDRDANVGLWVLKVGQSVGYGYIFSILLPNVFASIFGGVLSPVRRVLPVLLVALVFPGLISFPLSDAPSFGLLLCALALFMNACKSHTLGRAYVLFFASGVFLYFAYNTRPVFMFSIMFFLIAVCTLFSKRLFRRAGATFALVMGVIVGSVPQIMVNYKYYKTFSPLVVTDLNGGSLFVNQLAWGMVVDKYETYMDPAKDHGTPVFYANPKGVELLRLRGGVDTIKSYTDMWEMMLEHPLVFAELYIRHIASGLDARDGDVYTTRPSYEKDLRSLIFLVFLSIGLVQLVAVGFSKKIATPRLYRFLYTSILIAPCVAIVPGAVETRFFFSIYCLAYCAFSFIGVDKNSWKIRWVCAVFIVLTVFAFNQRMAKYPIYQRPEIYVLKGHGEERVVQKFLE